MKGVFPKGDSTETVEKEKEIKTHRGGSPRTPDKNLGKKIHLRGRGLVVEGGEKKNNSVNGQKKLGHRENVGKGASHPPPKLGTAKGNEN